MSDRPVLVTVPNVELVEVGTWLASTGVATFTPDHLASAVAAQADPAVRTPVLKLGHVDPRFDGEPALGRVENLRLSDDRMTLLGDLTGVPAWLADVMGSAFPSRSIEGFFDYTTGTGTKHTFVLTGLALLGVQAPAVETLADIAALYGLDPVQVAASAARSLQEEPMPNPPVQVAAAVSLDQVRQAFYASDPARQQFGSWAWIREVYTDHVIVDDDEGHLFSLPWSEGGDQTTPVFDLEAAKPVRVEYVDAPAVAASAEQLLRRGGLRERVARLATQTPPAEPAAGPTHNQEEATMADTLNEGLRQRLGINDADATDEALLSALDEALNERAETTPAPLPEGMVAVPEAAWNDTVAAARSGAAAAEQLRVNERERVLAAARDTGRILPTQESLAGWRAQYDRDPAGTTAHLAAAAPLLPVKAAGHAGTGPDTDDDAVYASLYGDTTKEN